MEEKQYQEFMAPMQSLIVDDIHENQRMFLFLSSSEKKLQIVTQKIQTELRTITDEQIAEIEASSGETAILPREQQEIKLIRLKKKIYIGYQQNDNDNLLSLYIFDDNIMTNAMYLDSLNRVRKYIDNINISILPDSKIVIFDGKEGYSFINR